MSYSIHSKFDKNLHMQTFINYLEAIIEPSGEVHYAVPSHVEKLIKLSGEPKEAIYTKMPGTASPLHWLLEYTGCVSIWSEFHMGTPVTETQKGVLDDLIASGLTK